MPDSPWQLDMDTGDQPLEDGVPDSIVAGSPGDVQSVVCLERTPVLVGTYEPGGTKGYRIDVSLRVVSFPAGQLLAGSTVFEGSSPPGSIEVQTVGNGVAVGSLYPEYGDVAETQINTWLTSTVQ